MKLLGSGNEIQDAVLYKVVIYGVKLLRTSHQWCAKAGPKRKRAK